MPPPLAFCRSHVYYSHLCPILPFLIFLRSHPVIQGRANGKNLDLAIKVEVTNTDMVYFRFKI